MESDENICAANIPGYSDGINDIDIVYLLGEADNRLMSIYR